MSAPKKRRLDETTAHTFAKELQEEGFTPEEQAALVARLAAPRAALAPGQSARFTAVAIYVDHLATAGMGLSDWLTVYAPPAPVAPPTATTRLTWKIYSAGGFPVWTALLGNSCC